MLAGALAIVATYADITILGQILVQELQLRRQSLLYAHHSGALLAHHIDRSSTTPVPMVVAIGLALARVTHVERHYTQSALSALGLRLGRAGC